MARLILFSFITTAGSLVRRTFFCFFSYNSNKCASGGKTKTRTKFEFRDDDICSLASDERQLACQWRAACDGRTRLALRLALARPHHSASTGCARAAGLAAARRDWQLAASRPASTQLSQMWAARPDGLAKALSARRRASARRQHLELGASAPQESRYGVKLQLQL